VAPFYDMLCVEAYLPRQTMSMAIAGENKPGWVEGPHWDAMAYEAAWHQGWFVASCRG
jgi:serine/threonine-protein kinase HipA